MLYNTSVFLLIEKLAFLTVKNYAKKVFIYLK